MKSIKRYILLTALIFLLSGFVLPTCVFATTLPLGTAFSNYDPPQLFAFGNVELTQLTSNSVQFGISGLAVGAGGSETDLQWFYFNTSSNITDLQLVSYTTAPGAVIPQLIYSYANTDNDYRPDGDGYFDGRVDFGNGNPQVSDATFVLGATALSVDDFLELSTPHQGADKGDYMVAVHLQSTTLNNFTSEFVGGNPGDPVPPVPEPATMLLFGTGLAGFAGIRRKFFKK